MARIPDAGSIGRVIRSAQAPIARVDTRNVGVGLDRLAAVANNQIEARSRYQFAQASSDFLVKKSTQDSAYDNDQDYGTIENRYTENVGKALEESAALIEDPTLRNEFLMKNRVYAAEGAQRIRTVARRKEEDVQRGYLTTQLDALVDSGLASESPVDAMDTADAMLLAARDMGYISAEDAAARRLATRQNLVTRSIEMKTPSEQLRLLQEKWVTDNLPVDVQVQLRQEANRQLLDDKAITNADTALAQVAAGEMDYGRAMASFESISDPDERELTERRFDTQYNRYESAKRDEQLGLLKKYDLQVRRGDLDFFSIPQEDLARMDPPTRNALQNVQPTQAARSSELQTVMDLHRLKASYEGGLAGPSAIYDYLMGMTTDPETGEKRRDTERFPVQPINLLKATDAENWIEVATNAEVPDAVKGLFNAKEKLASTLDTVNNIRQPSQRRTDDYAQEELRFENWWQAYQRDHSGKDPDAKAQDDYFDSIILRNLDDKVVVEGWFNDVKWNAATPAQKLDDIDRLRKADRFTAKRVDTMVGPNASPDRWRAVYELEKD